MPPKHNKSAKRLFPKRGKPKAKAPKDEVKARLEEKDKIKADVPKLLAVLTCVNPKKARE